MIDYESLKNRDFGHLEHTYTEKDTMLYALGLGLGSDPADAQHLRYLFEETENFAALPTMPVVLGDPGFWSRNPETGINWRQILHGEQSIDLHAPIPVAATVLSSMRIAEIVDKGPDKGAFIYTERKLTDKTSNTRLATLRSTIIARGDGGFGGPVLAAKPVHKIPDRDPDLTCDFATLPQAALIYRLSGDRNPLHISPEVAAAAGFKSPILHGLCTLGIAGHAILNSCCANEPERLRSIAVRFSAPVYPGETIRTDMWCDTNTVSFRARVVERDAIVLNNGRAEIL